LGQVLGLVTVSREHVQGAEEPPLVGHVEGLERQARPNADRDRRRLGDALMSHGQDQHCPKNAREARAV
jgi:hypothetical protein